jgi:NAD(P)-dependent dehydrogenase (short-subunit alcohol dehydrogenase family)
MSTFQLTGMTAVITGGGSGIGRAIAELFARNGIKHLILIGRRLEKLEETKALLPPSVTVQTMSCDLTSPDAIRTAATKLKHETIDILVSNAGVFIGAPLAETTDEMWQRQELSNLYAPFALTRELLPNLLKSSHPSVLNISSTLAVKPIPGASAYNTMKAGLLQLTKSLALELAPQGIRVNAILPAIVDTPMYRGRFTSDAEFIASQKAVDALHPIGRMGTPMDIAHAALYLVSREASWVTGVALPVDGGMLTT